MELEKKKEKGGGWREKQRKCEVRRQRVKGRKGTGRDRINKELCGMERNIGVKKILPKFLS